MEWTIRAEAPADREGVFAVEAAAFAQPDEARLVEALRVAAQPQLSLVALLAEEVVGHVFFSPVEIESRPTPAAALGPIAVAPAHQGKGVGSALVRAGLARCAGLGWRAVFLVGDPAYYARFGFVPAVPRGFHYGDAHFDPALQLIEIEPGALADSSGHVRFHPAFAAAEGGGGTRV